MTAAGILWAGCAPQPVSAPVSPPPRAQAVSPAPIALTHERWRPWDGRMDVVSRRRHLNPQFRERPIFIEDFDHVSVVLIQGWRVLGPVQVQPVRLAGAQGFQMKAPVDAREICGIERRLDPQPLRNRQLRLDARISCRTPAQAAALAEIELFLRVRDESGAVQSLPLPLAVGRSPGWEVQSWWLRIGPGLSELAICIHARRGGGAIVLDELKLIETSGVADELGGSNRNVIVDGDFETGRVGFFTSALRRWPNGDALHLPQSWRFESDAAHGDHALGLRVMEESGRIGFGPLDLARLGQPTAVDGAWYYLSFHARSDRSTTLTATLRTRNRIIGRAVVQTQPGWQRFRERFFIMTRSFEEAGELEQAELVFDFLGDGGAEANHCCLDAVCLTDKQIEDAYEPSAAVALGIIGPRQDDVDLAQVVDDGDSVSFTVRMVPAGLSGGRQSETAAAGTASQWTLTLDVLDGWDQAVWSKTSSPSFAAGRDSNEGVQLQLPRGYYRILADLWNGEPGHSTRIAGDRLAFVVIDENDAVPMANYFGLSVSDINVSARTTHLGAGWVWTDWPAHRMQSPRGGYEFTPWEMLAALAARAEVEVMAGLTLPGARGAWDDYGINLLAQADPPPMGLMFYPPPISPDPDRVYREELAWARAALDRQSPETDLIRYSIATDAVAGKLADEEAVADVIGFSCPPRALPEQNEPLLAAMGSLREQGRRLADVSVSVRLGGPGSWQQRILRQAGPVQRLADPIDPVVAASRMVRAMLIRGLAGVQWACAEAVALQPAYSIYEDDAQCLHERDLSPRPAVVAYDLMTSLLNLATLVRWIDLPDGSRILLYQRDDGGMVAACWRPFGLTPGRLRLPGLPAGVRVIDGLGVVQPVAQVETAAELPVNEMVRYVVVRSDQRTAFIQAVERAVVAEMPETRPAH